jgi:Lipid A Biosynthesis N-terminal domain
MAKTIRPISCGFMPSLAARAATYFSFFGGALLLAYACYRADPVFIIGQATGLVIYSRNLYFICSASGLWKRRRSSDRLPKPSVISKARRAL